MIPDEAVEAAWEALMKNAGLRSLWSNASPEWWERYRASMRAALEAAAPHMLAQAKVEVLEEAADDILKAQPIFVASWLRARARDIRR